MRLYALIATTVVYIVIWGHSASDANPVWDTQAPPSTGSFNTPLTLPIFPLCSEIGCLTPDCTTSRLACYCTITNSVPDYCMPTYLPCWVFGCDSLTCPIPNSAACYCNHNDNRPPEICNALSL